MLISPRKNGLDSLFKEARAFKERGSGRLRHRTGTLGVLSHHLNCEMKSPHLVDFSRFGVEFWPNLSWFFLAETAEISWEQPEISRDFAPKTREFFDKIKVAERTRKEPETGTVGTAFPEPKKGSLRKGSFLSIIVNPRLPYGPNFSKLISKFWKLVSKRKYALTPRKYARTPRPDFKRILLRDFWTIFGFMAHPPSGILQWY